MDGAEYTPYTYDAQEYGNGQQSPGQYDNPYDFEDQYGAAELAGTLAMWTFLACIMTI